MLYDLQKKHRLLVNNSIEELEADQKTTNDIAYYLIFIIINFILTMY